MQLAVLWGTGLVQSQVFQNVSGIIHFVPLCPCMS